MNVKKTCLCGKEFVGNRYCSMKCVYRFGARKGIHLSQESRKKLSKDVSRNYGIGRDQARLIITNASVKFQHTAYPMKDMLLLEEVDADKQVIIDTYGLNVNIFSSKTATFENVKNAIIQCYQDTIIPEADEFTQALSTFLKVPKGTRLVASYDHLSIMKENNEKGMNAIESIVRSLTQAVGAGILRGPQATRILENELGMHLDQV